MKTATLRTRAPARLRRAIRRRAIWLTLLAMLAALVVWRQGMPRPIVVSPTARPVLMRPPLANKLVRANYHQLPLSQALADLSRQVGVPFNVDWETLNKAGLQADMTVNFGSSAAPPIPLSDAMVGLGMGNAVMDADYETTPLWVSTGDKLSQRVSPVVYPVGDLLQIKEPWASANYRQDQEEGLAALIEAFVEPAAWKDAGGMVGIIKFYGDSLIVTATPMMHYQIKQLLAALRRQE